MVMHPRRGRGTSATNRRRSAKNRRRSRRDSAFRDRPHHTDPGDMSIRGPTTPPPAASVSHHSSAAQNASNLYRISFAVSRARGRLRKRGVDGLVCADNNGVSPGPTDLDQSLPIIAAVAASTSCGRTDGMNKQVLRQSPQIIRVSDAVADDN